MALLNLKNSGKDKSEFFSGNVNVTKILIILERYFGKFYENLIEIVWEKNLKKFWKYFPQILFSPDFVKTYGEILRNFRKIKKTVEPILKRF